jgi:hypothetical protein
MQISQILPWLIPLIITLFIGGARLYELNDKVISIQHKQNTEGVKAIKELSDLKWRVHNIEEYCCQEIKPWPKEDISLVETKQRGK